jgi:hypothetical protein
MSRRPTKEVVPIQAPATLSADSSLFSNDHVISFANDIQIDVGAPLEGHHNGHQGGPSRGQSYAHDAEDSHVSRQERIAEAINNMRMQREAREWPA